MTDTLAVALPRTAARSGVDFDALYRSSRDDVYAYVATLLRDAGAAEDVTATAFERAYRRRSSFSARRGTPRAWLFGIARNAALDELRRRSRTAALGVEPPADALDDRPSPEEGADLALRRRTVRRAIAGLDARERELIALKFFARLSKSELAGVLRVSESNAGTIVHRAVQKMRKACHVMP